MKKIFGILALVAFVAAFTSCNKTCTCKTFAAGAVVSTVEQEIDKGKKCKDYTAILVADPKTGVECR